MTRWFVLICLEGRAKRFPVDARDLVRLYLQDCHHVKVWGTKDHAEGTALR